MDGGRNQRPQGLDQATRQAVYDDARSWAGSGMGYDRFAQMKAYDEERAKYARMAFDDYQQQQAMNEMIGGFGFEFPEFPSAPSGPSYEEQMAEQMRIQGENQRDALYSEYMSAAGTATDFINQQIGEEQSRANLYGVEYEITNEQKAQRINDYFASIWGAGQQSQLEALMEEWGEPEGFEGFSVTRGNAENVKGKTTKEQKKGTTAGITPAILIDTDEEEPLGGQQTLLGV